MYYELCVMGWCKGMLMRMAKMANASGTVRDRFGIGS